MSVASHLHMPHAMTMPGSLSTVSPSPGAGVEEEEMQKEEMEQRRGDKGEAGREMSSVRVSPRERKEGNGR